MQIKYGVNYDLFSKINIENIKRNSIKLLKIKKKKRDLYIV